LQFSLNLINSISLFVQYFTDAGNEESDLSATPILAVYVPPIATARPMT